MYFESFEVDRALWQLRHGEQTLPLNRKTFDLLLYLLEHNDRVVTKDELLQALWPGQFIEESNLTQQVFLLRKALAKHASGDKIIETIPGRGYRFAVPVRFETQAPPPQELPQHHPKEDPHSQHPPHPLPVIPKIRVPWLVIPLLALLLLATYLLTRPKTPSRLSIASYTQITHDGHAKSLGGTDGTRLYFTRLEKSAIAQVSTAGGAEALLPLALQDPWSGAVSPNGSTLLIVSQAGGQGPATSLWSLQLVDGTLRRLANAISSAWSPDGETIVYATASGDLFLMRSNGTDPRRIASVGGNISSIAWSSDGQTIRFSRDGLLWQIAPNGSNLHQLLPQWTQSPTQSSGDWSPTGTYFFVADGQIWMLDNAKTAPWKTAPTPVQLTHGPTVWDRPLVSRDGSKIWASGRTRRGELVRFSPESPQPAPLLAGISAEFVTYSKAANAVAYVSYPEGILWRAGIDGANPTQLTEPPLYPKSVCWSPDGAQLAFVDHTPDQASAIFVINATGPGKPHRLIADDTATETDPSWSPDGQKIAFATAPNVGASAHSELRIFNLATKTATTLPGSDGLLVPRWSPDGHILAAMTLDAKSLKLLDLATGRWSTLNTGAVAFPEWSHDGVWINYVRWTTSPAILRIRVADGKQETLADLTGVRYTGSYTLWMGLDPQDRPMMLRDAGTDDIYALTLHQE